jgi:anti-anti-sigma factor
MVFTCAAFFRAAGPAPGPAEEDNMTVMPLTPPLDRTVVTIGDSLNLAAAPALREQLIDVLHRGTGLLILDLSHVLSCDTAGLAVLVGTQRRARLLGTTMRLLAPSRSVAHLLRTTGLDRSFSIRAA